MKRTSLLAALVLVVGLLAGCGNSSSSGAAGGDAGGVPTDATVDDFCGAFVDMIKQAGEQGTDVSDADAVKFAKDLAAKLSEVGTPKDMPDDARKGFELAIQKIDDLPDDATQQDMQDASGDLSAEETKYQEALTTYITDNCMGQLVPSASPSN